MSNNSGTVILGTLVGAAMGFAAGILLAPAKGSETRDQLAEKGEDLKKSINEAADKAVTSLKDLKESAERTIKQTAENAKSTARGKLGELDEALENA